jgi:hypothetical protein
LKLETMVEAAANLLDDIEEDWYEEVDDEINLEHCEECPLGQIFGHYMTGKQTIGRFIRKHDDFQLGYYRLHDLRQFGIAFGGFLEPEEEIHFTEDTDYELGDIDKVIEKVENLWQKEIDSRKNNAEVE